MKTILIGLLLVSTSVSAQSFFGSESFFSESRNRQPRQDFQEQHRQRLDRQAEQSRQELIEDARHRQQMRQLDGLRYKGTDPFGRPLR